MKTRRGSAKKTNYVRREMVRMDRWLKDYLFSIGLSLDGPNEDNPEFYRDLAVLLWGHLVEPDSEHVLAGLRGLKLSPEVGFKLLIAFETAYSDTGWNVSEVAAVTRRELANLDLYNWADRVVRRILTVVKISALDDVISNNPRFMEQLIFVLLRHLETRDKRATKIFIEQLGCSCDMEDLIRAFEKAWGQQVLAVIRARMTPEERQEHDWWREAFLKSYLARAKAVEADAPDSSGACPARGLN